MSRVMKYSGYGWIGEIPVNWKISQVKRIFSIGRGRVIATTELKETGFPVYSSQTKNNGVLGYLDSYDFDRSQLTWTTDGANAGSVFLREGKHNCTNVCGTLMPKDDSNDLRYLCYALAYISFYHKRADINGYKIMNNEMAEIEIILPPLLEQQRIASFLDSECSRIDAVIEKTRASIEEYKNLKQAIITQAVTKGIRPNRPMKDSGIEWIGEIASDYIIAKIKVGVTKVGSGKTPSGGAESYAEEGILFLRSQNVYDTGLVLDNPTYITDEIDEEMKNTRVQPQDVLLNITGGSIGRCCIFPAELERANVNQHVSIIRVIKSVFLPEYMHYYWLSKLGYMSIHLYQTGGNREGMTADAIKNSPIPLMPIKEQQEIVDYLDSKCLEMDSLIEKKERFLAELETYRKSLIFEYVTGKKEVTSAPTY
jgi:Restriction endonuclease S subunits